MPQYSITCFGAALARGIPAERAESTMHQYPTTCNVEMADNAKQLLLHDTASMICSFTPSTVAGATRHTGMAQTMVASSPSRCRPSA